MTAPDEAQLDKLQRDIEAARAQAEEHGTLPKQKPQQQLIDPDGDGVEDPYRIQIG